MAVLSVGVLRFGPFVGLVLNCGDFVHAQDFTKSAWHPLYVSLGLDTRVNTVRLY